MSFQGWTNYPTYCVNHRLTEKEGPREWLYGLANSSGTIYDKVNRLRKTVEALNPVAGDSSLFSGLVSAALVEVNWVEIIETHMEGEVLESQENLELAA